MSDDIKDGDSHVYRLPAVSVDSRGETIEQEVSRAFQAATLDAYGGAQQRYSPEERWALAQIPGLEVRRNAARRKFWVGSLLTFAGLSVVGTVAIAAFKHRSATP